MSANYADYYAVYTHNHGAKWATDEEAESMVLEWVKEHGVGGRTYAVYPVNEVSSSGALRKGFCAELAFTFAKAD